MTLTANGLINQADETHPVPKEILANFIGFIVSTGNLINGRKTFELLRQSPSMKSFPNAELVVVSRQKQNTGRAFVANSPRQALDHLRHLNFSTALIAGGTQLNSAFHSECLVNEIYLNMVPTLNSNGIRLTLAKDLEADLELIGTNRLNKHIIQLHYKAFR